MFWLRIFSDTASYISLIGNTIKGIMSFVVIMIMIIMAFATGFYILTLNRLYGLEVYSEKPENNQMLFEL